MSTEEKKKCNLESILPTFYARLFRTKVSRKTFLYLDFRFVLFWRKNIGAKSARILLVKLTPDKKNCDHGKAKKNCDDLKQNVKCH
jgi:hypothetical protein